MQDSFKVCRPGCRGSGYLANKVTSLKIQVARKNYFKEEKKPIRQIKEEPVFCQVGATAPT
jgi:hypothetical protein